MSKLKGSLVALLMCLALVISGNLIKAEDGEGVTRIFSSHKIPVGEVLTVYLEVNVTNAEFYVIDEIYPDDWIVEDNGGLVNTTEGHLKKVVIGDAVNTTYTYKLRVPQNETGGSHNFTGNFSMDNVTISSSLYGDESVTVIASSNVFYKANNTCHAQKGKMVISVYPCNATRYPSQPITQYVNFTWTGGQNKTIDWYFAYNNNLTDYHIYLKRFEGNGTAYWQELTNKMKHVGRNMFGSDWELLKAFNETIKAGKTYETMWVFKPEDDEVSGKWRIFGKLPSKTIIEAIDADEYIFADPYWDEEPTVDGNTILLIEMDEGSGGWAYDTTDNDWDFNTVGTSVTWDNTTKKFGNSALKFDGTGLIDQDTLFESSVPANLSFAFWFRRDTEYNSSASNYEWAFGKQTRTGLGTAEVISGVFRKSGDTLRAGAFLCYIRHLDIDHWTLSTTTTWKANTWYHIACTYGSRGIEIWVNGTRENITTDYTGTIDAGDAGADKDFAIGDGGMTNNQFFEGWIDEFQIRDTQIYFNETPADVTPPVLYITQPTNTTYNNNTINHNLTANENLSSAWADVNGEYNFSMTNQSGEWNYLNNSLSDGVHWSRICANDTSDNWACSIIYYTIDTTVPQIIVIQPLNITYDNNTINFNVTGNEVLDWVAVELSGYNHTLTNQSGEWNYLNDTLADGSYEAIFWFNDTTGNMNTTSIIFSIDTIFPKITILQPLNITYDNNNSIDFNVTVDEPSDTCIVELDGTNQTMTNTSGQWQYFNNTLPDGHYYPVFYCNDTVGNMNSTTAEFIIDIVISINILSPLNITYDTSPIDLNVSFDKIPDWVGYSLNNASNVTSRFAFNKMLSSNEETRHVFADDDYVYFTVKVNNYIRIYYMNNLSYKTDFSETATFYGVWADDEYIYGASSELNVYNKTNMSLVTKLSVAANAYAVYSDADYIYAGGSSGYIYIWHKNNLTLKTSVRPTLGAIRSIHGDDDIFYAGESGGNVYVYNRTTISLKSTLSEPTGQVRGVFGDANNIYATSFDNYVHIWDKNNFSDHTIIDSGNYLYKIYVNDDFIYAGSGNQATYIWDKNSLALVDTLNVSGIKPVYSVYGHDNQIFSGTWDNVYVYDKTVFANTTITPQVGSNHLIVYANSSTMNSSEVYFTYHVPLYLYNISVDSPIDPLENNTTTIEALANISGSNFDTGVCYLYYPNGTLKEQNLAMKTVVNISFTNLNCTFTMQYYETDGTYNITIIGNDTDANINQSDTTFVYNILDAFALNTTTLNFGISQVYDVTIVAFNMTNTGNQLLNLEMNGTNLTGSSKSINVSQMKFDDDSDPSDGTVMTTSYQTFTDLSLLAEKTGYIQLTVPVGILPDTYNGTITIRSI